MIMTPSGQSQHVAPVDVELLALKDIFRSSAMGHEAKSKERSKQSQGNSTSTCKARSFAKDALITYRGWTPHADQQCQNQTSQESTYRILLSQPSHHIQWNIVQTPSGRGSLKHQVNVEKAMARNQSVLTSRCNQDTAWPANRLRWPLITFHFA